jgi:ArsR family metal-binding transcriptional regulator
MLIEHYDLKVFTPPCDPGAERFSAFAELTVDISEMLPYLNATLGGAIYHRSANALTWKKSGHAIAFHASQIATSNVEDYEAAVAEIDSLIELVNRTWEQRAEVTPDYETHQRAPLMVVYRLLPQTNCKQCGEPTCYSFAIKLVASQKKVSDCPLLAEPQCAEQLAALRHIVIDAPASGRGTRR